MSLLLEALKKAERAKEQAQRQADNRAENSAGLTMEPAPPAEERHITRRDELPDIAQPMEINSDDIRAEPPREAPPVERRAAGASRTASPRGLPPEQPVERATAKKVFEAKFREPNPKLPFYIVMGLLGAFAVGTVVYFWIQLSPPPPLVNPNPPPASAEQAPPVPVAKPAPAAPQASASQTPGLPDATPAAPLPAAPTRVASTGVSPSPAPAPAPVPPAAQAARKPVAASAAPAVREPAREQRPASAPRQDRAAVAVRRAAPTVDPLVSAAYAAYNAGDLATARSGYERALASDPTNRDAMLGMAAVEMRSQNPAAADALYQRLLRADPRDPHAQAGMLALRSQSTDPVAVESRVKSLLASDPESGALHFTLGNQFAQQGRWAEAQQSYFKAYSSEPDNPDFAYNLAVSLDQLRQPKLALEYYRRALALAQTRSAAFDRAGIHTRVQELSR